MKMSMVINESINDFDVCLQKLLYCWYIANQFVDLFFLCVKYIIAVVVEVVVVNIFDVVYMKKN